MTHGSRVLEVEFFAEQLPPLREVLDRSGKFKVVNVDNKEQTKLRMKITRAPTRDAPPAFLLNFAVAEDLPVPPGFGVSV